MTVALEEPVFVMHGARAAVAGGMSHIEEQVKALELAVIGNTGLAFDLAKTLIESACKTILTEREISFEKNDDLPKLFRAVTQCLPFLPPGASTEAKARQSLAQTLNGLNTALQGVCQLRNDYGFVSHGSDSPRPAMEGVQALLAAQAADAIVGFLYRVHRQDTTRPRKALLEYDDNPEFNEWLDDQTEAIQILLLPPYRPSDVLFNVDQEAYRDLLMSYKGEDEKEDNMDSGETHEQIAGN
jgi:hypothetical protein